MSSGIYLGWGSSSDNWWDGGIPMVPPDLISNQGSGRISAGGSQGFRLGVDIHNSDGFTGTPGTEVQLTFSWTYTGEYNDYKGSGTINLSGDPGIASSMGIEFNFGNILAQQLPGKFPFASLEEGEGGGYGYDYGYGYGGGGGGGTLTEGAVLGVYIVRCSVDGVSCDNELVAIVAAASWTYGAFSWYQRPLSGDTGDDNEDELTDFWTAFDGTTEVIVHGGNILSKNFKSAYLPAIAPIPATPGYWEESDGVGETCVWTTDTSNLKWQLAEFDDDDAVDEDKLPYGLSPPYPAPKGKYWTANGFFEQSVVCTPGTPLKTKQWVPGTPAVPGRAEQLIIDYTEGWNASATSIAEIDPTADASCSPNGTWFSFKMPKVVGVVVGLSEHYATTEVEQIGVGFHFSGANCRLVIDGVIGQTPSPYNPMDEFAIHSFGARFILKNKTKGNEWVVNANDARLFSPVARLIALFYMGSDKLITGKMGKVTACSSGGTMAAVTGFGFAGDSYGRVEGVLAPVVGGGGILSGVIGRLAPLQGIGSYTARIGIGVMAPMVGGGGFAGSYIDKSYGVQLIGKMAPMAGAGVMHSGHSGWQNPNIDGDASGMLAAATGYGFGGGVSYATQPTGKIASLHGAGLGAIEGWASISSRARATPVLIPYGYIVATLNSAGALTALLDVQMLLSEGLDSQAANTDDWTLNASVLTLIDSMVQAGGVLGASRKTVIVHPPSVSGGVWTPDGGSDITIASGGGTWKPDSNGGGTWTPTDPSTPPIVIPPGIGAWKPDGGGVANGLPNDIFGSGDVAYDFDTGGQAWVLNTRTGAISRYQNYQFNSFATISGEYFGANADGVYLLDGATDGQDPIYSRITTGMYDLGSANLKHVRNVYLGVASDGVLRASVVTGNQRYTYQARRGDAYSRQQRVDVGRGLRATMYGFELINTTPFELDSIEINADITPRRI